MTAAGCCIMIVSVSSVVALTAWCFVRVLTGPNPPQTPQDP